MHDCTHLGWELPGRSSHHNAQAHAYGCLQLTRLRVYASSVHLSRAVTIRIASGAAPAPCHALAGQSPTLVKATRLGQSSVTVSAWTLLERFLPRHSGSDCAQTAYSPQ